MINKFIAVGRLGKETEVKTFDGGGKIASNALATSERWKDKESGEWKEKTEWITIQGSRYTAEALERRDKGDLVYVEGKIRTRSYEKDGATKYITYLDVQTLRNLTPKQGEDSNITPESDIHAAAESNTNSKGIANDDDLPF